MIYAVVTMLCGVAMLCVVWVCLGKCLGVNVDV